MKKLLLSSVGTYEYIVILLLCQGDPGFFWPLCPLLALSVVLRLVLLVVVVEAADVAKTRMPVVGIIVIIFTVLTS